MTSGDGARRGRPRTFEDEAVFQRTTRILIADGLGSLTLQRLAEEIGVTNQAIARRFTTKAELLHSYALWFAEVTENDRHAFGPQVTSPLELARLYLVQPLNPVLVGQEWAHPNAGWIVILLELQREPELSGVVQDMNRKTRELIGDLLADAQHLGELGPADPHWLAEYLLAVVSGAVVRWIFNPDQDVREDLISFREAALAPFLPYDG